MSLLRVVGCGIDSLYLSYDFPVSSTWERRLERAKAAAADLDRARKAAQTKDRLDPATETRAELAFTDSLVQLGGFDCVARAYGSGGKSPMPFLLASPDVSIAIHPSNTRGPCAMIQVQSEALWREGFERMVQLCDQAMRTLSDGRRFKKRRIARVDMCIDFQAWDPSEAEMSHFVFAGPATRVQKFLDGTRSKLRWTRDVLAERNLTRADVIELHARDEAELRDELADLDQRTAVTHYFQYRYTGIRAGAGGAISQRVYNKSAEITFSGKQWFFPMWERNGAQRLKPPTAAEVAAGCGYDSAEPVWRVEVQFRRAALKQVCELRPLLVDPDTGELSAVDDVSLLKPTDEITTVKVPREIKTPEQFWKMRGDLWRYALLKWGRLTLPTSKRKSRGRTNPYWEELAYYPVDGQVSKTRVARQEQLCVMAEKLFPNLRGTFATWGSLIDGVDSEQQAVAEYLKVSQDYGSKVGETFLEHLLKARTIRQSQLEHWRLVEELGLAEKDDREKEDDDPSFVADAPPGK